MPHSGGIATCSRILDVFVGIPPRLEETTVRQFAVDNLQGRVDATANGQISACDGKCGIFIQEFAPTTTQIKSVRYLLGAPPQALHPDGETTMKKCVNFHARTPTRWVLLPAVAAISALAGATNAFAFDQQATDDALDYALNLRAAGGSGLSGPYAQALPASQEGTVYAPRHRRFR